MLVKICGITRLEDAEAAVELGAGALGFVFWPKSPRYVDPEQARAIVSRLPPFVTTVGVFVDQPPRLVNGVAARVGLSAVQLHGDETIDVLEHIERPVVKALGLAIDGRRGRRRVAVTRAPADRRARPREARRHRAGRSIGSALPSIAARRPGTARRWIDAGKRRRRHPGGAAVRHRRLVGRRVVARRQRSRAAAGACSTPSTCATVGEP